MAVGHAQCLVARRAASTGQRAATRPTSISTGMPRIERCAARSCCRSSASRCARRSPRARSRSIARAGRIASRATSSSAFRSPARCGEIERSRRDAARRGRLNALLSRQHYRLAWWRVANDEINWRRFFDINELAGLRMEHAAVFEDVACADLPALCRRPDRRRARRPRRRPCRSGRLLPRLRAALDALAPSGPHRAARRAYLVVEKILLRGETLPATGNATAPAAMTS